MSGYRNIIAPFAPLVL